MMAPLGAIISMSNLIAFVLREQIRIEFLEQLFLSRVSYLQSHALLDRCKPTIQALYLLCKAEFRRGLNVARECDATIDLVSYLSQPVRNTFTNV